VSRKHSSLWLRFSSAISPAHAPPTPHAACVSAAAQGPSKRYTLDAPPARSDAATAEQEAYINAERLRQRLIELNP
jgi:hypothetical protein